jgi:DNA-binding Lrp family transcriptional regulator
MSLANVAEVLGVSTRTVLNRLRDLGVATRNVGANQWT